MFNIDVDFMITLYAKHMIISVQNGLTVTVTGSHGMV
jgi:hypothetical protein